MATQDVFAPYELYLDSEVWPSRSYEGAAATTQEIFGHSAMAPQYACGALAKLVRWAVHEPAGNVAMLGDPVQREEEVRHSRLGLALAARALNQRDVGEFESLYRFTHSATPVGHVFVPQGQAVEAEPTALVADIAVNIHDHLPGQSLKTAITWSARVVEALTRLGLKVTWEG